LNRVVLRISAGFLVGALVLLATALWLSAHYVNEGRRLSAAGDVQGAIDATRTAARLDPFGTEALETQATLFIQQGRNDDAASALKEATQRDPHDYIPYLMLGNLQLNKLNELDGAAESYRDVLRLNPKEGQVREALGQALIEQGKLGEAKDVYEKARDEGKLSLHGLYDLGRIYVRTGEPREGLQTLIRAKSKAVKGVPRLDGQQQKKERWQLVHSMKLAIADAYVVEGKYTKARKKLIGSKSPQAPALLQLLDSNPDAYRESVLTSEIY
jgi:tetratricopeptide (TPR) repeat protein